jgi:hypothetical protein
LAIISQVAKSASAFVRAFLAILVLELEDMVVRLFARPNSPAFMATVGQFAWVFRLAVLCAIPIKSRFQSVQLTSFPTNTCPLLADIVAKVENRTTLKISRKSIFGLLCCRVAFQRHYGGP